MSVDGFLIITGSDEQPNNEDDRYQAQIGSALDSTNCAVLIQTTIR